MTKNVAPFAQTDHGPVLIRQRASRQRWLLLAAPALSVLALELGCGAGPAGTVDSSSSDGGSVGTTGGASSGTGASPSGTGAAPSDGGTGAGATQGSGGSPGEVVEVGGVKVTGAPTYYRVNRITHSQWENSVKELLALTAAPGLASSFFPDAKGNSNFSNNEHGLEVNDSLAADYSRAAETLAQKVTSDAAALGRLGSTADASAFIANLGKRAFRRDLTAAESSAYLSLWNQGATFFASGDAAKDGARVFLEALLQAPAFLYRTELVDSGTRLSGRELATKVSFLLRDTAPDDATLAAADSGAFDTNEGLAAQVTQMLAADGMKAQVRTFFSELYALTRQANIQKDATQFPSFTAETATALHDADLLFFEDLYTERLGLRDLFLTKTAFVNKATASIYGLTSQSATFNKVTLDDSRPGYLTRAGFLAMNATLKNPDPIHRGVDINIKMLCADLSPPPGVEIPPLPTPKSGQTNREAITDLTSDGICGECHGGIINPPGFALEGFDATGKARTKDGGKPIDTTGSFGAIPGNPSFTGPTDLAQIMADSETAHACFAARLSEFALSRDLGSTDTSLLQSLATESHGSSASIQDLLLAVTQSPAFTNAQ